MKERPSSGRSHLPIIHLFPNLVTLGSIAAGLTAIRFGFHGEFEWAVRLILLACVLDGIDGRLARFLQRESLTGAELDSLADVVNFGVAPALIVYFWALQDMPGAGWLAALAYVMCCVLRLARFNVMSRSADNGGNKTARDDFFVGVPSPAGAGLVMFPMFVSFLFSEPPFIAPALMAAHLVLVGFLMISRLPTYSFKTVTISRDSAKFFLLAFVALISALLTFFWATLVMLSLAYLVSIIWAFLSERKLKKARR